MAKFTDLDDESVKPSEDMGAARIKTAGIHTNMKFKSAEFKTDKAKKTGKIYSVIRFVFENEDGEIHEEAIFEPPSKDSEVTWYARKYEKINGKSTHTGEHNAEMMVKILNNDVVYFMLDLADALGFTFDGAKKILTAADNFEDLCKIFIRTYQPNDKKRIDIKLLWENSDKTKKSNLGIKGLMGYYPVMNDFFATHIPDRRTQLFINNYEHDNKMSPKYDNSVATPPAAGKPKTAGASSSKTYDTQVEIPPTGGTDDPF